MKFFSRLNIVSALYAFLIFLVLQLMVNVYRISRLTGWELGTVNFIVLAFIVCALTIFTILMVVLLRKWMKGRKATYWSVILWVPYLILYTYSFTSLFPIENPGEVPNPGIGLLIIGMLLVYPIYIALLNFFSISTFDERST